MTDKVRCGRRSLPFTRNNNINNNTPYQLGSRRGELRVHDFVGPRVRVQKLKASRAAEEDSGQPWRLGCASQGHR